jgi:hypothetical protein
VQSGAQRPPPSSCRQAPPGHAPSSAQAAQWLTTVGTHRRTVSDGSVTSRQSQSAGQSPSQIREHCPPPPPGASTQNPVSQSA